MRQVSAALHREHLESLALLERVETAVARAKTPPADGDARWGGLLRDFRSNLAGLARHFAFEQDELFPLLAETGDPDIAAILEEEHRAILTLAARLEPLARSPVPSADWASLRAAALELVERQISHIQKEEMSLLPILDDALDDARDGELAERYLASA